MIGDVNLSIEIDREDDGRWIAEALELPGVMTYGATREEAISNTEKLAIEVIADRVGHGELPASSLNISFQVLREQLAGASRPAPYRLAHRSNHRIAQAAAQGGLVRLRVRVS